MTSAAIYARVSSARQKKDQTIGSQSAALREHAARNRLEVPAEWVFEDEGHSGATLVRPGLEALRDLAAQGCVDVILVYSPDRLARKFACQALLIEEFARAGARVEFVKNGARGDSPEDQLLVQFQGMFAEYEKAQLAERYRRGKAYRARAGSVNVLGGAPFGYRYLRKTPECGARYEVIAHEAALVAELFRRYADDGATIADLAGWLTSQGVPTRTGKARWDRSVIWGMLRNPAYAGRAVFGKTQIIHEQPGLNRIARLQGRGTPRAVKTVDRPREEWTEIPVPAIVDAPAFDRVQARLAGNKRFAPRNSKLPASLLQGMAACTACGYAYYRTSTRTTARKIYYYRCLGSDNYRYEGGRVCASPPVRADYLDQVVWEHITGLLADPALIRAEIGRRPGQARTSDPVTRQRARLETALAKASKSVTAMIEAYSEQLVTIDELRAKVPHLRAREANLRSQLEALDVQAADRDAYLRLADGLDGFLAQLRGRAATASTDERRRVLKLLVKDVLIGPEKITIRHRIPARASSNGITQRDPQPDTEGDNSSGCQVRWGRALTRARESVPALRVRQLDGAGVSRRRLRTLRGRRGRALRQPGSGTAGAGGPAGADARGRPGTAPGQDQGRVLQGQQPAWLLRAHRVHLPGVHVPGPGGASQDR
jgi:site-specific DNA recombinase